MKVSKPFAIDMDAGLGVSLIGDKLVLVTQAMIEHAMDGFWDTDTEIVLCEPGRPDYYLRVGAPSLLYSAPILRIELRRYFVDGYFVRVGWADHEGKRYIVTDGEMRRLTEPPKSPTI